MSDLSPRIEDVKIERRVQTCHCSDPDYCNRGGRRYRTEPGDITGPELLAVLTSMGAEIRESRRTSNDIGSHMYLPNDWEPGEYVVIPKSMFEGGTE